jgi:MFS family permease
MLGFAFTLQSIPPILTLIIKALALTHTQAGLLMSFFALPPIFISVFTGFFSDRLGPYRVGIVSFIFMITGGLILALSNTFLQAAIGRVIAGIGASTIAIVAAQIISRWFRGREIGTAMGIYNTAMPVGTITCFTAFGRIGERLGWRMPVFITLAVSVAGLISFLAMYRSVPEGSPGRITQKGKDDIRLLSKLLTIGIPVWSIGLCWMWFNASVISFSTFAPDYFVARGFSIGFAGILVSLLMWGSLILSPIMGRLVDRFGNYEAFIGLGGLLLTISIFLVIRVETVLLPMALMSFAVAFVPAPVFSFPSKLIETENLGLVFGIFFMMSSFGMFFGAILITFTALVLRIIMKRKTA